MYYRRIYFPFKKRRTVYRVQGRNGNLGKILEMSMGVNDAVTLSALLDVSKSRKANVKCHILQVKFAIFHKFTNGT